MLASTHGAATGRRPGGNEDIGGNSDGGGTNNQQSTRSSNGNSDDDSDCNDNENEGDGGGGGSAATMRGRQPAWWRQLGETAVGGSLAMEAAAWQERGVGGGGQLGNGGGSLARAR